MPGDKGDQGERVSTVYNYIPVLYIYSTCVCVGVQVLHALLQLHQILGYDLQRCALEGNPHIRGVCVRVTPPPPIYLCVV